MANILKCTFKKSLSVTTKLVKWGAIITLILGSMFGIGYLIWSIREVIGACWGLYSDWMFSLFAQVWYLIGMVPWFVWIIVMLPVSIIIYSYLWCYNKQYPGELTRKKYCFEATHDFLMGGIVIGIVVYVIYGLIIWPILNQTQPVFYTFIYFIPLMAFSGAVLGLLFDIVFNETCRPCLKFSRLNYKRCRYLNSKFECEYIEDGCIYLKGEKHED